MPSPYDKLSLTNFYEKHFLYIYRIFSPRNGSQDDSCSYLCLTPVSRDTADLGSLLVFINYLLACSNMIENVILLSSILHL